MNCHEYESALKSNEVASPPSDFLWKEMMSLAPIIIGIRAVRSCNSAH